MKNDKNKDAYSKVGRIMEIFWLSLAILSLLVVIYIFFAQGITRANIQYLVFPGMAGAMFAFRYVMRRRMERNSRK